MRKSNPLDYQKVYVLIMYFKREKYIENGKNTEKRQILIDIYVLL